MKTTANSTNKKLVFIPLSDLVKYEKAFRDRPIVYQRELFQYNIDETTIQAFYESKERTIR